MIKQPEGYLTDLNIDWRVYDQYLEKIEVSSKTRLLNEGDIADKVFFIEKGSVRVGYDNDGKDISVQFYFEDDLLTCCESLFSDTPSRFFIETTERTTAFYMTKEKMELLFTIKPELAEISQRIMVERLVHYSEHLLTYLKDTPEERYNNLIRTKPFIFQRIPQRHIASYLGMTNVSLSRIKGRK
ncbi:MAG: Crp/Fnr family transcriptional regulator [Cytophagales bacterium]|nr:Crp/Fnr family transcriptional regulator [Cytophaga sp.]